jgi:hypothetical protein
METDAYSSCHKPLKRVFHQYQVFGADTVCCIGTYNYWNLKASLIHGLGESISIPIVWILLPLQPALFKTAFSPDWGLFSQFKADVFTHSHLIKLNYFFSQNASKCF